MSIAARLSAVLITLVAASPAFPAVMYVHDSSGNLGTVDTATGSASVIGNMGVQMTDIAFDPTGNLYGLSFTSLYSIDKITGASSLIGAHGISNGNALVFGKDGTLYGAGNTTTSLYALNTATGVGTSLGSIGFASGGDLAFSGDDFYLASSSSELVKIDLADLPNSTAIGSFGVSNVFGLATAPDGKVFGVADTSIYEINLSTGAATNGVNYGGQGLGIAYGQSFFTESGAPNPSPVPVPAAGVLLLGGLATFGVARLRRRRG